MTAKDIDFTGHNSGRVNQRVFTAAEGEEENARISYVWLVAFNRLEPKDFQRAFQKAYEVEHFDFVSIINFLDGNVPCHV